LIRYNKLHAKIALEINGMCPQLLRAPCAYPFNLEEKASSTATVDNKLRIRILSGVNGETWILYLLLVSLFTKVVLEKRGN